MGSSSTLRNPAHPLILVRTFVEKGFRVAKIFIMRKSFGLLIMLWGLSQFFATSFVALDGAARESFKFIEAGAIVSQEKVLQQK